MKKLFIINIFAFVIGVVGLSAQCVIPVVISDVTEETCVGSSDASAVATGVGAGMSTYVWSNGQTTATAINLTTGTYTVTATDANGCTGIGTATVTLNPEGLWIMNMSTPVSCNGGNDGTAHAGVMTGVPPYTYIWNDPAGTTTADPVGLTAGTYTVTITDSNGCTNAAPVTVTEPTTIVLIQNSTNETCNGNGDGSATITSSGGTGAFTYSWSNGAIGTNNNNLNAGSYTVTATDANGCTSVATVNVGLTNPIISTSGSSTSVLCFGGNDGTATVVVNSGNGPFTYSWNNGQTGATATGLVAGNYTVTVTGANGCTETNTVTVSEPTQVTISVDNNATTDVSCQGGNDGSIAITSSGGTGQITYMWSNGATTGTINNLTEGSYTVTATDANGCTNTSTVNIGFLNPTIMITGTSTPSLCFGGSDGTATVTVNSGNGPFTYSWSNGQTGATATGLVAGDYTVTITGANGCTATTTVTVSETPNQVTIAVNNNNSNTTILCHGGNDGSITIISTGGNNQLTYLWSNGATTATITNLTAGTYTVTATNANGCTAELTTTITQPNSALTAAGSGTNVTTFGGNDGTATVTPTGGTPPYTYLWSNGATTQNITNLSAGTYTVTITDANGCTTTTTIIITQPPPPQINLISTSTPSVCGVNDGTATVTATGGMQPYTYLWSDGQTTSTATGLAGGTYTVTVTDNVGTTSTTSVTVPENSNMTVTASGSNETCAGSGDGHVSVTSMGGVGQNTFLWSNGATTSTVNNLSVGTYTVTVTDSNGCSVTASHTIEISPEGIWVDIIPSPVLCFGGSDGSATTNVTTGVSPYTYAWSNGATTPNLSNVPAGTYTVSVTDANGCVGIFSTDITTQSSSQLVATPSSTNTNCGTADGTASVLVTGGTPGYTYQWSNGATTQDISGLSPGTYTVTATDAAGCTVETSVTVTGTGSSMLPTVNTVNPSAPGALDGSIDLEVTGGTAPYTYLWSNGATTQDISGLLANCYTVTITDAVGCTATIEACIDDPINPPSFEVEVITTDNGCMGNNMGTATANVITGGIAPFTYMWSNSTGFPLGTTQTIIGLTNGIYFVTVTDANGTTATNSGAVLGSGGVGSSATSVNISCNGGNDGSASADGIGGAPGLNGYIYNWSTGAMTQDISNLGADTYTVTVTDQTGCTSTSEVTITEPTVITTAGTTGTDPSTPGGSDGSIDLVVSGGTPGYTFLWSNGATTEDIIGLIAGCYQVTVTDSNGCSATAEQCIIDPPVPPIALSVTSTADGCTSDTDGTATVTTTFGGLSPFTYLWKNNNTPQDSIGNTATITGLPPGVYHVTVTDAANNTATTTVEVFSTDGPNANATANQVSCNSLVDGAVFGSATGGTAPYDYQWSDGNSMIGNDDSIMGLAPGTYTVTVTDAAGCTDVVSTIITEDDPISIDETLIPLDCNGDANASIQVTANGGNPNYTYAWSTGSDQDNISGLSANDYTVTVTDANDCSEIQTFSIVEPLAVALALDDNSSTCDEMITLNATISAGTNVAWFDDLNGPSIGNGTTVNYNLSSGDNMVYAVAQANGCQVIDSVMITQNAVDVSVDPTMAFCQGTAAQLMANNNIASNMMTYQWTPATAFIAGADSATPTLNTDATGISEVYLVSENQFGCLQHDTINIQIQDTTSNFIETSHCEGFVVNFANTSPNGPTDFIWDFGDGNQTLGSAPMHTYADTGTYTVMMILPAGANNAECLPDTVSKEIQVFDDPIFNTAFDIAFDPCVEDSAIVVFTDMSTNVQWDIVSWDWDLPGGATSSSNTDSVILTQSGTYTASVVVVAAGGCVDSLTQTFDLNIFDVEFPDTVVACLGDDEVALNPFANPDYNYSWLPTGDNQINPMVSPDTSTNYTVTITDPNGIAACELIDEVFVFVPPVIEDLQTTPDEMVVCVDTNVVLNASSAIAVDYTWYNTNPLVTPIGTGTDLPLTLDINAAPQYYYVEAQDAYGCTVLDSVFAGNGEILLFTPLDSLSNCIGNETTIFADDVLTNGNDLMYEWTDINGNVISIDDSLSVIVDGTSTYSINISNEYGCDFNDEFEIQAIDLTPLVQAFADPDTIFLGETTLLDADHPEGNYTYTWSNPNTLIGGIDASTEKSPEAAPTETTTYQVALTDNATGCTALASVLITVIDECEEPFIFFPNAFSPNDDGENDVLYLRSLFADEVFFMIYNRWGEKVFESNDINSGWDGRHNGEAVCSDVYGYYLRVKCLNGEEYIKKGNVTVLK